MTEVTMTIHEALCEVKVSDKRIAKAIAEGAYVSYAKPVSKQINGKPIDEFNKQAQAAYQKVQDLMARNRAIKAAVSRSNASTLITVGGVEMTVAEAIYHMRYGINNEERLLQTLDKQLRDAVTTINYENGDRLEEKCQRFLDSTYGANRDKVDAQSVEETRSNYIKNNTLYADSYLEI